MSIKLRWHKRNLTKHFSPELFDDRVIIKSGTAYLSWAPEFTPSFLVRSVLLIFLVFLSCPIISVPCCGVRYDFCITTMFVSSLPPVGGLMSYLRYLCLFAYSSVQHILCCVLFVFVLCSQFLWIVHFWLPLRFSLMFIYKKMEQAINIVYYKYFPLYIKVWTFNTTTLDIDF